MNGFSSATTAHQQENTTLLSTPGAATIKALSIIISPFLRNQLLPEGIFRGKALTQEWSQDIASLHNSISMEETEPDNTEEAVIIEEAAAPEISATSKALGMVHHLKHTHTKTHLS